MKGRVDWWVDDGWLDAFDWSVEWNESIKRIR